jgi:galactonate dehydratase
VKEIEPYLIGKDPRPVAHHWQAIYRHAFYRGGPILTSALSGIDQALWDIKGKALGVPVYELLGGPTRDRIRAYAHASTPEEIQQRLAQGFTAFKTGPAKKRPARYIETPAAVQYAAEKFAELRKLMGNDVDLATDFHGAISPATAKLLIKALEPYQPKLTMLRSLRTIHWDRSRSRRACKWPLPFPTSYARNRSRWARAT